MTNAGAAGFDDLVGADGVAIGVTAADKSSLLAMLADRAAAVTGQLSDTVLERLMLREALGSTGFGGGAAIPHARLPGLPGVVVLVALLDTPIAFGAIDGEPVDIIVLMLSPEAAGADHLKALARISRTLRDPARCDAIRSARSADDLRLAIAALPEPARRAA